MSTEEFARVDLERLFSILTGLATRCGYELSDIVEMIEKGCDEDHSSVIQLSDAAEVRPEHVHFLSDMISLWSMHENYVDDMGNPALIPEKGPEPSLESLYALTKSSTSPKNTPLSQDEAIALLKGHGAVEEVAPGSYSPPARSFFANTDNSVAIEAQIGYLRDFAETIYHNTKTVARAGLFQYVTTVGGFPKENIALVKRMLSEEGLAFIEAMDEFMVSERTANLQKSTDKTRIGIGVYFYQRSDG